MPAYYISRPAIQVSNAKAPQALNDDDFFYKINFPIIKIPRNGIEISLDVSISASWIRIHQ